VPARDSIFLKSEKGHNEVIPHHHTIMGTKEEGQGRDRRSMEVGGGDLGGGRVRGRVGAICFYFPLPLAFFGFSPLNFLIRAKMHKFKKGIKGRIHDPIFTHPECGHRAGGPNGGGWWRFFFWVGAKKKIGKLGLKKK